jgi:iron complex outermembrane receptor protein
MLMSLSSLSLLLLAGALPLATPGIDRDDPPVAAPVPKAEADDPDAQANQDIVVTARRREERVQDVPIALSVLSGEDLADAAILFEQSAQLSDQHTRAGCAVWAHERRY